MNIQKIYNAQINTVPFLQKNNNSKPYTYGIKMTEPMPCDIVSFKGGKAKTVAKEIQAAIARKEARAIRDARQFAESNIASDKTAPTKKNLSGEERKWGVSKSTAKQIRKMILEPQKQIHDFMDRVFSDLKANELSPKNILLDYSDRAKSVISIMEKSATRDWNSVNEILQNMTDLNGAKIVFNYKTGKQDVEKALDRLIPLIKTKQVILKEIELQRPKSIELQRPKSIESFYRKDQEEFDYVSKVFLDKLEDAQEEVLNGLETDIDKIKLIDRPLPKYTKFNYCALHLILQLNEKGSRPFELQVMGAREAKGKFIDDGRFKFFEGKELDQKFAPLITLWKRLLPEENKATKEEYFRYCKDANLQLRKDEIQEYKTQKQIYRPTGLFKTVREYNLTPEYDLNKQYKLLMDSEAKKAASEKHDAPKEAEEKKNSFLSKQSFQKIINKFKPNSSDKK